MTAIVFNAKFGSRTFKALQKNCQISYGEGLGMSPCIMGLTTQDPYILKECTELYKIIKFRANWANIEQDTVIQKLKNLLTIAGPMHSS